MANPVFVTCPVDNWKKVATNVMSGTLHKVDTSPYGYLQTYRLTGAASPTTKTEGVPAFEKSRKEPIASDVYIDVYLYSLVDEGRVRVDIGSDIIGTNMMLTNPETGVQAQIELNGGLAVNIQDQHSLALNLTFIQSQGVTTLVNDVNVENTELTLTSSAGFVAGNVIGLFNPSGIFYFGGQVGAPVGAVITLDTPIDKVFESSNTTVIRAVRNMAVNGAVTTQIFQIGPVGVGTSVELDITRIMGYLQDGTVMDDAKFGGISALTNGIVLRQNNGVISNLWNAKSNGDLNLLAFDFAYTERAPAGSFGARFRNSYAGQHKRGVSIRLEPGDILEVLIQDDLTDLEAFYMMAQGHVVTD